MEPLRAAALPELHDLALPSNDTSTSLAHIFKRENLDLYPCFEYMPTESGIILMASTPGLKKEEISLEIIEGNGKHDFLVFSGESKGGEEQMHATHYRKFSHKIRIPKGEVKEAKYEYGLLTVRLDTKHDEKVDKHRKQVTIA